LYPLAGLFWQIPIWLSVSVSVRSLPKLLWSSGMEGRTVVTLIGQPLPIFAEQRHRQRNRGIRKGPMDRRSFLIDGGIAMSALSMPLAEQVRPLVSN
jgi:hypothetical protein